MTTLKEDTLRQQIGSILHKYRKGITKDNIEDVTKDISDLITKHEVEAKLEGQIQEAVIALANLPDVDSTEIWLQTRVFTLEQQLSELQKKGQS